MTTNYELMQKVAEVAPEKHAFFVKVASELRKSPFAEEINEELNGIMKKAQSALGSFASGAGKFLGGVGAAAGTAAVGGIALALAGDAYGAAKRGLTKSRNYQSMLEANPDLRQAPADRVQRAFSTLHRLNPEFSGDPTVAGSYVRSQAQSEMHQWNPQEMKTLIDAHKNLQEVDRLPQFKMDQGRPKSPGRGLGGGTEHELAADRDAEGLTDAMMGRGSFDREDRPGSAGVRTHMPPFGPGQRTSPFRGKRQFEMK